MSTRLSCNTRKSSMPACKIVAVIAFRETVIILERWILL